MKSTLHHSPDVEERVLDEVQMKEFSGPSEDMSADQRPDLTSGSKHGMTSTPSRFSTPASQDKGIFPRPLRYVRNELNSVYVPLSLKNRYIRKELNSVYIPLSLKKQTN